MYAGGTFTNIGGKARNNIAALDATSAAATAWNPNANNTVFALAVSNSTIYAGGDFTSIGGQSRRDLAKLSSIGTGAAAAIAGHAHGDEAGQVTIAVANMSENRSVRLEGTELIGRRPAAIAALGVARTFQNLALFTNLDVVDNLMLGRHHLMRTGFVSGALWWGRAKSEEVSHRRRCEEIIDLLELQPYRHARVGTLPYGIKKRIELARALCMDPKLLLLDEPVAGMNLEETEDTARYILEVRERLGISVILVEHDMRMVMDIADRVVVLDFGLVIATGAPAEVQSDPAVIAAYLGTPAEAVAGTGEHPAAAGGGAKAAAAASWWADR